MHKFIWILFSVIFCLDGCAPGSVLTPPTNLDRTVTPGVLSLPTTLAPTRVAERTPTLPRLRRLTAAARNTLEYPTYVAQETSGAATEEAASTVQAVTREAYETAFPLPTPEPLQIITGEGITASVKQGGLELQVVLPKRTFWASEFVELQLTLRNDSAETFSYWDLNGSFFARVYDERGRANLPSPAYEMQSFTSPLAHAVKLEPGTSVTRTATIQIPVAAKQFTQMLWVTSQVERSYGRAISLVAGPIPLTIVEADSAHQLQVHLKADNAGYEFDVTDGLGHPLDVPASGFFQITTAVAVASFYADMDALGHGKAKWNEDYTANGPVKLWVWAEDHAVALATLEAPGETSSPGGLNPPRNDGSEIFESLQLAKERLGFQVYRLGAAPLNRKLVRVEVRTEPDSDGQYFSVTADYRMESGGVIELRQSGRAQDGVVTLDDSISYDPSTQIRFGTRVGYLTQTRGRWRLEWELDRRAMVLTAPHDTLTQDELLGIAASVEPLP